jgi:RNA polymerase sigma-70 factor (ECF subfamily)
MAPAMSATRIFDHWRAGLPPLRGKVTVSSGVEPRDVPADRADQAPALEAIYDEFFDFVWRSLRRLGVRAELLDDALQDVFLVVHRRLPEFERRSSVKTWLFGICLRVASDYVRRGKLGRRAAVLEHEPHDAEALDPLEQAARGEAVQFLDAQLMALDPDKRAVFILAELEGMSCPEIAEAVGANVNTVMSRLKAARARFEAAVRRHRAQQRHALGESHE